MSSSIWKHKSLSRHTHGLWVLVTLLYHHPSLVDRSTWMDDLAQNGLIWRQDVESWHIWALTLSLPRDTCDGEEMLVTAHWKTFITLSTILIQPSWLNRLYHLRQAWHQDLYITCILVSAKAPCKTINNSTIDLQLSLIQQKIRFCSHLFSEAVLFGPGQDWGNAPDNVDGLKSSGALPRHNSFGWNLVGELIW